MNKHKTIAIFLPMAGCKHHCSFCDQHTITGVSLPSVAEVVHQIEVQQTTIGAQTPCELAFFGGTFTALPLTVMQAYLEAVKPFSFSGIRISTRPDAIDDTRLRLLQSYGVTHIELGIQSMDDTVLSACQRGHTAKDTQRAAQKILQYGFVLGGQMMVGLPASTPHSEQQTARWICEMGATQARIYPLCVFADTPLATQMKNGTFSPLSIEEATLRCADAFRIFLAHKVTLLRIGLCANEALAGTKLLSPYHPAMGELVYGQLYREWMEEALCQTTLQTQYATVTVAVPRKEYSRAVGQKKCNLHYFLDKFGIESFTVTEDPSLRPLSCTVTIQSKTSDEKEVFSCDCYP